MIPRGKHTSKNKGMGLKGRPSHRAEVSAMFPLPTPYGWRVYRQGSRQALNKSATGHATEADAWSAGGQALDQVIKASEQSDSEADMLRPARQSADGAPAPLPAMQRIDAVTP